MFFYAMPMHIALIVSILAIIGVALIELLLKSKVLLKTFEIIAFFLTLLFVFYVIIIHRYSGESVDVCLIPFYSFVMAKEEIEVYRLMLFNTLMFIPFDLILPFLLIKKA